MLGGSLHSASLMMNRNEPLLLRGGFLNVKQRIGESGLVFQKILVFAKNTGKFRVHLL